MDPETCRWVEKVEVGLNADTLARCNARSNDLPRYCVYSVWRKRTSLGSHSRSCYHNSGYQFTRSTCTRRTASVTRVYLTVVSIRAWPGRWPKRLSSRIPRPGRDPKRASTGLQECGKAHPASRPGPPARPRAPDEHSRDIPGSSSPTRGFPGYVQMPRARDHFPMRLHSKTEACCIFQCGDSERSKSYRIERALKGTQCRSLPM